AAELARLQVGPRGDPLGVRRVTGPGPGCRRCAGALAALGSLDDKRPGLGARRGRRRRPRLAGPPAVTPGLLRSTRTEMVPGSTGAGDRQRPSGPGLPLRSAGLWRDRGLRADAELLPRCTAARPGGGGPGLAR